MLTEVSAHETLSNLRLLQGQKRGMFILKMSFSSPYELWNTKTMCFHQFISSCAVEEKNAGDLLSRGNYLSLLMGFW